MLKVQNHASKLLVLKHGHDSIINNTSKDEQEKMAKSQEGKRQRYISIIFTLTMTINNNTKYIILLF